MSNLEKNSNGFSIEQYAEPSDYAETAIRMLSLPNITGAIAAGGLQKSLLTPVQGTHHRVMVARGGALAYMKENPETGACIAVAEALRILLAAGATPTALFPGFQFGDPLIISDVAAQVAAVKKGIHRAADRFVLTIQQTFDHFGHHPDAGFYPIPSVNVMGVVNGDNALPQEPTQDGDLLYLLGYSKNDIAGSEYLASVLGVTSSPAPYFDLNEEANLHELLVSIIQNNIAASAMSVGVGGLWATLIGSSIRSSAGFRVTSDFRYRKDAWLFGEKQSRILLSVKPEKEKEFLELVKGSRNMLSREDNLGVEVIGTVWKDHCMIDNEVYCSVGEAQDMHADALSKLVKY